MRLSFERFRRSVPSRTTSLHIPEDIYHCIFAYLIEPGAGQHASNNILPLSDDLGKNDYRQLLITLTQVCRFFTVVFMPILLRSRSISIEHVQPPPSRGFWKRIEYMCKTNRPADFSSALVCNDPLARSQIRHVEECVIFYPRTLNLHFVYYETHTAALLTVIRTLPCTIKSLSLQGISISHEFFMALRALTNLESLTLSGVVLSSEFVSNKSTIRLDIKSFSLFLCQVESRLPPLDTIISLLTFLNLDSVSILRTDDIYFLDAMASQCKTLNMVCLEHYSNITRFYYPAQMSDLLTLTLNTNFTPMDVEKSDPSPEFLAFMPKLQNLRCPLSLAHYLIPGRPLTNIDIYDRYSFRLGKHNISTASALLRLIQLSTAPIKKLHVPASVCLGSPHEFWNAFPDLDELTLTLRSRSDTTDPYAEQVSAITDSTPAGLLSISHLSIRFIHSLQYCKWVFNLAEQAKIATRLHQAIPALKSIDFVTWDEMGWTWRLRYSQETGTRWLPFVMGSSRAIKRAAFANSGLSSFSEIDFEGVLAKVFDGATTNSPSSSYSLPG